MPTVPAVGDMDDETFMRHMEHRHAGDLAMSFEREPDRAARRLRAPVEWRTYHETLHRMRPEGYEHEHLR